MSIKLYSEKINKYKSEISEIFDLKNFLNLTWMPLANFFAYIFSFINYIKASLKTRLSQPLLPGIYLFAINSFFWVYTYQEMQKIGIKGVSQILSPVGYSLKRLWYSTPLSNFIFAKVGFALSTLFISIVPLSFYFVNGKLEYSSIFLTFIYFSSPIAYSMAFIVGRYHAPAWFFAALTFVYILNSQFIVGMLCLIVVALTSSSVMFFCTFILCWLFLTTGSYAYIGFSLPAIFLALIYVFYVLFEYNNNFINTIKCLILPVFKGIGTFQRDTKYQRQPLRFGLKEYGIIAFYFVFIVILFYSSASFVLLSLPAFILYIINCRFARFADTQTTEYGLMLTTFLDALIFCQSYLVFTVLLFWSLFPFLYKTGVTKIFDHLKILKPLHIDTVTRSMNQFFSKAKPNSRIMIVFSNPEGRYERIFDEYRHALELAIYAGYQNCCCVFPNWYMVFSFNKVNDPDTWVKDCNELKQKIKNWTPDYIIYDSDFLECDFDELWCTTVSVYEEDLSGIDEYSKKHYKKPQWIMAKVN